MSDTGYTIIGAVIFVLSMLIMRLIACRFFNQLNKQERYRRRKEHYYQQLRRQKDRFLFYIKINKTMPQSGNNNRQAVTVKGCFKDLIILRVWYTDRPRECDYISTINTDEQIKKILQILDKPNVEIITLNRVIHSIPLIDKTKPKE